jgi:hypothetical protein
MPKHASSLKQGLRMMQIGLNRVVLLGVLSFGETFFGLKGFGVPLSRCRAYRMSRAFLSGG